LKVCESAVTVTNFGRYLMMQKFVPADKKYAQLPVCSGYWWPDSHSWLLWVQPTLSWSG